ncbi:NAD(P) transhydrogenase subunit alpha [Rugosimonospora africana]|uniref:proton-translocating NAD(P)(+) transhydrogenase n=1 Tax=Rugosimonospora africana TaxID=556532 RepID=A0A8J3QVN1_9ACTN|nr:NAD(P) transhydrogenase subunit alpha [Rugosimonospora africana]GIH17929.1 NAD(P) transhydrogenase subunit alpha [Rugosimonospora africana]
MTTSIGVMKESEPGEHRVAVVPAVVPRLRELGCDVLVENDAGTGAFLPDSAYTEVGAAPVGEAELLERADVLVCVRPPDAGRVERMRQGQVLVGLLEASADPGRVPALTRRGVDAVSLDLLPRTLSRAQSMDALTSQASIAGYKAALVAADAYGRYFPMLMTAAGTAKPAQVLVLGVGVAGLSAIGTAKRLGAQVTGYDIRPETRDEVHSMGARFLDLAGVTVADGEGGYARALSDAEREAQQEALQQRIGEFDVVITTALVPGRKPPLLVTQDALKGMRPGSVVVDIAAGPHGGNVEGSQPERSVLIADGVRLIGAGNLPSAMAPGASAAYARNITALLAHLIRDGVPRIDLTDEILAATVVSHAGQARQGGGAR